MTEDLFWIQSLLPHLNDNQVFLAQSTTIFTARFKPPAYFWLMLVYQTSPGDHIEKIARRVIATSIWIICSEPTHNMLDVLGKLVKLVRHQQWRGSVNTTTSAHLAFVSHFWRNLISLVRLIQQLKLFPELTYRVTIAPVAKS